MSPPSSMLPATIERGHATRESGPAKENPMRLRAGRHILGVALAALIQTSIASGCETVRRTSVALSGDDGLWTVPASVDGKPVRLVLDTGAERSVITRAAVERLGLRRDEWVSSLVRGVGGIEWQANAVMRSFEIGGLPLRRLGVSPALTFVVAPLASLAAFSDPPAGLLGADYLSRFDLELDPAGQSLTLYSVDACGAGAIAWKVPHLEVPALRPRPTVLLVPVRVDGLVLAAQLDTGASVSLLTPRGMARLGLRAGTPGRSVQGLGPRRIMTERHRVATLEFGPLMLRDVEVVSGAPPGGSPFDMILGLDVLRRTRVWISYATDRVLVGVPEG